MFCTVSTTDDNFGSRWRENQEFQGSSVTMRLRYLNKKTKSHSQDLACDVSFSYHLEFSGELLYVALNLHFYKFFAWSGPSPIHVDYYRCLLLLICSNSAILLLRTVTLSFPGSFIVEFVGLSFKFFDPGAKTSYRPSKFFFDLRFPCILRASLTFTTFSVIRIGRQAPKWIKRDSPSVLACSRSLASRAPESFQVAIRYHCDIHFAIYCLVEWPRAWLCLLLNSDLQYSHKRD